MSDKWISVNVEPPITGTMSDIVLLTDGGLIGIGWFHVDYGWWCDTIPNMKPTHWLPIPKWRKEEI